MDEDDKKINDILRGLKVTAQIDSIDWDKVRRQIVLPDISAQSIRTTTRPHTSFYDTADAAMPPNEQDQHLADLVKEVADGDGSTVQIRGVKIAKCDDKGMTDGERGLENAVAHLGKELAAAKAEVERLKRENAFYDGIKKGRGRIKPR